MKRMEGRRVVVRMRIGRSALFSEVLHDRTARRIISENETEGEVQRRVSAGKTSRDAQSTVP